MNITGRSEGLQLCLLSKLLDILFSHLETFNPMLQILSDANLLFFLYNFINKATKNFSGWFVDARLAAMKKLGDHCKVVFALLRIPLYRRATMCVWGGGGGGLGGLAAFFVSLPHPISQLILAVIYQR